MKKYILSLSFLFIGCSTAGSITPSLGSMNVYNADLVSSSSYVPLMPIFPADVFTMVARNTFSSIKSSMPALSSVTLKKSYLYPLIGITALVISFRYVKRPTTGNIKKPYVQVVATQHDPYEGYKEYAERHEQLYDFFKSKSTENSDSIPVQQPLKIATNKTPDLKENISFDEHFSPDIHTVFQDQFQQHSLIDQYLALSGGNQFERKQREKGISGEIPDDLEGFSDLFTSREFDSNDAAIYHDNLKNKIKWIAQSLQKDSCSWNDDLIREIEAMGIYAQKVAQNINEYEFIRKKDQQLLLQVVGGTISAIQKYYDACSAKRLQEQQAQKQKIEEFEESPVNLEKTWIIDSPTQESKTRFSFFKRGNKKAPVIELKSFPDVPLLPSVTQQSGISKPVEQKIIDQENAEEKLQLMLKAYEELHKTLNKKKTVK